MAKSKKKETSSRESKALTRDQCDKIWPLIKAEDWATFAKESGRSDLELKVTSPVSLLGLCPTPAHTESNPSFTINTHNGICGCFGCKWTTYNPIVLYSVITQKTIPESFSDLNSRYHFSFLPKNYGEQLEAQRINSAMKRAAEAVFHDELCQAIECGCTGDYEYAKKAVDWLLIERKISKDIIPVLPIGIFPTTALLSQKLTDRFIRRAALENETNPTTVLPVEKLEDYAGTAVAYFSAFSRGGINDRFIGAPVFTLYNSPHNIGRFKIRLPEKGHTHVMPPDEFEDVPGVYGLGWDQYKACWDPKSKQQTVYAVEGEMDCLSIMAHMAETGNIWGPVVSLGGTGSVEGSEESLIRSMVTDVHFIGDAPTKGGLEKISASGDEAIVKWLAGFSKLRSYIFSNEAWDKLAPADDPDNAMHLDCVGPDKTFLELYLNRKDNYQPSGQWVFERAYDKLEKLDPADYRGLTEAAVEVGRILLNPLDRDAYVQRICDAFPLLKPDPLKRSLTSSIVSEEAFIMRFKEAIESVMFLVGTDSANADRRLLCVGKRKETVYSFKLDSPSSAVKELATISGGLFQFVLNHVGWPSFVPNPSTKEGDGCMESIDKQVRYYANEAVLRCAVGLPDLKDQILYRQGYHCIRDEEGKIIGEYVVDGGNVFKIISRDHTGAHWIKLDGPRDGNIVFDTGYTKRSIEKPWYPGGLTVEILEEGNNVNIKELYRDLVNIYSDGFFFKNHHIVPDLLASMLLVLVINNCLPRQLMTIITGETNSGKSSLLSTLSPIGGAKTMRLLYCSMGFDGFTEAGISALVDNCPMAMCLDEAEAEEGTNRAESTKMIQELFRSCVAGAGLRVRSASVNGASDVSIRRIFCPIFYCAISGVSRPQDFNRMITVETIRVEGRDNVKNIIQAKYGPDFVSNVARKLAVGMYRYVPNIIESYANIEKDFSSFEGILGHKLDYRYASSLYPVLAALDVVGLDWREFLKEFVTSNKDNIDRATKYSESSSALSAMMHNPIIKVPTGDKDLPHTYRSIAQLMVNPGQRHHINSSSVGIYLDEERQLLLVLLDQALSRILPHPRSDATTVTALKQTLMRDKRSLTPDRIRSAGIMEASTIYLGKSISLEEVVVIEAGSWLTGETASEFEKKKRKEIVPQEMTEQKGMVVGYDRPPRQEPTHEETSEEEVSRIRPEKGETDF